MSPRTPGFHDRSVEYLDKGEFDKAIKDLAEPFVSIHGMPTAYYDRGRAFSGKGIRQGPWRLHRNNSPQSKDSNAYCERG